MAKARRSKCETSGQAETGSKGWFEAGWSWKTVLHVLVALCLGLAHKRHVSALYENDRHFSHLSSLEREMGFRTEMGLYYSYYKTVVEAPSFISGLGLLLRNNLTEYPDTINTLKRFNLYPEVVLGAAYRVHRWAAASAGIRTKSCFRIDRGDAADPVWSCEGLGDPAYFYLEGAWLSAALVAAAIFHLGAAIAGGNVFGGLAAVACFFFNHGEATRVQWTPPLRETFGMPLSLVQAHLAARSLEGSPVAWQLAIATAAYLLVWQFAQFALFAQASGIFFMACVDAIDRDNWNSYAKSVGIGLATATVVMFGNGMLLASWLFSFLVSAAAAARGPAMALALPATLALKKAMEAAVGAEDDAHVGNILRSKFGSYGDFHTSLYTCAREFDFLGWEMPRKTTATLLLPAAAVAAALVALAASRDLLRGAAGVDVPYHMQGGGRRGRNLEPAVALHVLQTAAYGFMAAIVMRLKLFLTPHLCVMAALLFNEKCIPVIKSRRVYFALLSLLMAGMTVNGWANIKAQYDIIGEYSNPELEELIEWVNRNLPEDGEGAMAGPMSTMANLLLSTRRPVVNHPHYEDAGLRNRTREVYKMYSRRTAKEYHAILSETLKARYLVIASGWCFEKPTPDGCGMTELWDREEPHLKNIRGPLCPKLFDQHQPSPFRRVFKNDQYVVLQV